VVADRQEAGAIGITRGIPVLTNRIPSAAEAASMTSAR
jgi:hypothetical protein